MQYSEVLSRDINGFMFLDKPVGLSSNALLQTVKRLFHASKAGHTGSLDPLATGMLIICFGEATKFSEYLLQADKRYLVTARLGEKTDTSDAEGNIIRIRPVLLNQAKLESELSYLLSQKSQIPSMFSALKYQGNPLYKYARKGITVERKKRSIHIYELKLHYWNLSEIKLEIHCSKGTYIRTIIDDLGERLGCGAHVTALRRLSIANYSTENMIKLSKLQSIYSSFQRKEALAILDAFILPIETAVLDLPMVKIPLDVASQLHFGQKVPIKTQLKAGLVRLCKGNPSRFFGVGEITVSGNLIPRRLIISSYV